MVKHRMIYVFVAVFLVAMALSAVLAVIIGANIFKRLVENTDLASFNDYVAVIKYNQPIEPIKVENTTWGDIELPIKGNINIVVPQYVNCPDVCHWESSIMVYLMNRLLKDGLEDKVVFVTIGTNPYYETLNDGREYMDMIAGDLIDQGVQWVWVLEDLETQKALWERFRLAVQPYCITIEGEVLDTISDEEFLKALEEGRCETYGVNHTAGFIVVDENGVFRYYISPTEDGWIKGQDKVAKAIYNIVKELTG